MLCFSIQQLIAIFATLTKNIFIMKHVNRYHALLFLIVLNLMGCNSAEENCILECYQHNETLSRGDCPFYNPERELMLQHVIFEDSIFKINITLEDANKLGVSEETYNGCLRYIDNKNKEVNEFLAAGGTYHFYNCMSEETPSESHSYSIGLKNNTDNKKSESNTYSSNSQSGKLYFPLDMNIDVYVPYNAGCIGILVNKFSNMSVAYVDGKRIYFCYSGAIQYIYTVTITLPEEQYPLQEKYDYLISDKNYDKDRVVPFIKPTIYHIPHNIEFVAQIPISDDPDTQIPIDVVTAECEWRIY